MRVGVGGGHEARARAAELQAPQPAPLGSGRGRQGGREGERDAGREGGGEGFILLPAPARVRLGQWAPGPRPITRRGAAAPRQQSAVAAAVQAGQHASDSAAAGVAGPKGTERVPHHEHRAVPWQGGLNGRSAGISALDPQRLQTIVLPWRSRLTNVRWSAF